jgi:hypothetical protein
LVRVGLTADGIVGRRRARRAPALTLLEAEHGLSHNVDANDFVPAHPFAWPQVDGNRTFDRSVGQFFDDQWRHRPVRPQAVLANRARQFLVSHRERGGLIELFLVREWL